MCSAPLAFAVCTRRGLSVFSVKEEEEERKEGGGGGGGVCVSVRQLPAFNSHTHTYSLSHTQPRFVSTRVWRPHLRSRDDLIKYRLSAARLPECRCVQKERVCVSVCVSVSASVSVSGRECVSVSVSCVLGNGQHKGMEEKSRVRLSNRKQNKRGRGRGERESR